MELKNVHTLDEVREIFKNDRFATEATGTVIDDFDVNYARCSMDIKPIHLNAHGTLMGGAIFTLADFCMAVAANGWREDCDTVGIDANINYMKVAKGNRLFAEAKCVKPGRIVSFWEISVTDDLGTDVAHFSGKTYTITK